MLDGLVEVDGEVVTRLGTKVDPRTAVIRVDGKRLPPISRARLPRRSTSPAAWSRRCRTPRAGRTLHRPGRRPARAALPRRPPRHRHRRADPAHQRRRLRAAAGAPVVRGGQDLRRRGRRRGHQGRPCGSSATASPSTTARSPSRGAAGRAAQGRSRSIVELVIHEGRNRIVRRLLDHVGHPVRRLTRTAIGPVQLRGRSVRASCATSPSTSSASCSTTPRCSRRDSPVRFRGARGLVGDRNRTGLSPKTPCPYLPRRGAMGRPRSRTTGEVDASCFHVPSRLPDQGCEGCARSPWGSWRMLTPARRP